MADQDNQEDMGRRGMLAWVATLAGAGLAWLSGSGRAEATHLATGTANADSAALHVNQVNAGTQRTFLVGNAGTPPAVVFHGAGPFSIGLPDALQGITTKSFGAGVHGRNHSGTGPGAGVFGDVLVAGAGVVGMHGTGGLTNVPDGVGVYGVSRTESGIGIRGQIPSDTSAANTIALYGENFSTNAGSGPGAGGFGCYGFSANGHGLVGATGTAGGGAVIGSTNGVPGAYAGIFYGQLVVIGAKNAAVPHPDGSHRLLYCMESPESWFEDFGDAALTRGTARVTIDPEFAAVADLSAYHVFLTPYGEADNLYVSERTPTSFTITERECGTSEISFAWRIVAKRKDIVAPRLAKVVLPKEPEHPSPALATRPVEPAMIPAPSEPPHSHAASRKHTVPTPKRH